MTRQQKRSKGRSGGALLALGLLLAVIAGLVYATNSADADAANRVNRSICKIVGDISCHDADAAKPNTGPPIVLGAIGAVFFLAGMVQLSGGKPAPSTSHLTPSQTSSAPPADRIGELERLAALRDTGIITDAQLEAETNLILGSGPG